MAMKLHIVEKWYPAKVYRRGFSDWFVKCSSQKVVEADGAETPRSVLGNLGFGDATRVVMNGSFLVKELMDTPLYNTLNGSDGFITIVKEESK